MMQYKIVVDLKEFRSPSLFTIPYMSVGASSRNREKKCSVHLQISPIKLGRDTICVVRLLKSLGARLDDGVGEHGVALHRLGATKVLDAVAGSREHASGPVLNLVALILPVVEHGHVVDLDPQREARVHILRNPLRVISPLRHVVGLA